MANNAQAIRFSAAGLSDALDSTEVFPGAMQSLQNLIVDPTTVNMWYCRPGAVQLTAFAGFNTPGFISALEVIGNYAYGMIASQRFPGFDEPFMFNLLTKTFVTISGVTSGNVPTSPATTGDWTPPQIAICSTYVLITHPGYTGTNGYFCHINIANLAAPVYASTNTATTALVCPPTAVATFYGRAWYACNPPSGAQPGLYFSDVLVPLTITNATNILTFDDNIPLTCLTGLPLSNQLGGVIQALIVFKGTTNIYQVTGDAASTSNPLAKNSLNYATGTLAANSVCQTPIGVAFLAPDGYRLIDFTAKISEPMGFAGSGVNAPFIFCLHPSRVNGSCNNNIIRISIQNGTTTGQPFQEYWFDMARKVWSGPHTCAASMLSPWGNTFVMAPVSTTGVLWQSDVVQSATSQFTEGGVALTWLWETCTLPDNGIEAMACLYQTQMLMSYGSPGQQFVMSATDQDDNVYASYSFTGGSSASQWGSMTWGTSTWGGVSLNPVYVDINWPMPVVFRRLELAMGGTSVGGLRLGALFGKVKALGYIT